MTLSELRDRTEMRGAENRGYAPTACMKDNIELLKRLDATVEALQACLIFLHPQTTEAESAQAACDYAISGR